MPAHSWHSGFGLKAAGIETVPKPARKDPGHGKMFVYVQW